MKTLLTVAACAAFMAGTLLMTPALALDVVSPAVVTNAGLKDQTDAFTAAGGAVVTARATELLKIAETAKSGPTDVVFATSDLLDGMKADIVPGSVTKIGRVHVVLAVPAGSPHPDISTVPKFIAALESAKGVVISNPDPARGSLAALMVGALLNRPEFAHVKVVVSHHVNGVGGLIAGEGDMALQFQTEVLPLKQLETVGNVPDALGAYADLSAAIMTKATDPA